MYKMEIFEAHEVSESCKAIQTNQLLHKVKVVNAFLEHTVIVVPRFRT